jgi:hypothetical protein
MRALTLPTSAVALLALGLTACASEETVQGECRDVFGGDICTWGTMVGDEVSAFGATVALASIENAPADAEMVFPPPFVGVVPLPPDVAAATGFDHLGVNWEPHGHPPGAFLTPHFDFHFYTIDPGRVGSIDCADLSKPADLPSGYTLPDMDIPGLGMLTGLCVPNMGMHAMVEDELDDTELFDASMILGYYEAGLIFLEPMIAQAKLLEAKTFTMDVPAMEQPGAPAMWPTTFEATYDEASRTYRFAFAGFPPEQGE